MRALSLGLAFVGLGLAALPTGMAAQSAGQTIFEQKCVACHTTGEDRLIGPGLAGVTERRDRAWIKQFIMAPEQLLADDSTAQALLQEYQVPMPNLALTDADAEAVIAFLESGGAPAAAAPAAVAPATEEQVQLGQELFQGRTRLANGGPTCNACHDVAHDAVIAGGVLAAELTTVFSRLGGPGVRAILGSPPFPVMQRAYAEKPLTEDEVAALVGFLERVDAEQSLHQPRDYGIGLFSAGAVGTTLLLILYSLVWNKRLRGSVNQAIFDRQITTT